jgi:hypothetical protein
VPAPEKKSGNPVFGLRFQVGALSRSCVTLFFRRAYAILSPLPSSDGEAIPAFFRENQQSQ